MEGPWNDEQMLRAQSIVMERFAQSSVAGHLAPHSTVNDAETTVRTNRFDFKDSVVIDREVFGLYEPFSLCRFTRAQVDEFAMAQGDAAVKQSRAVTSLTRAAGSLARWHDILFFRGFAEGSGKPQFVEMPRPANPPRSLRKAAMDAEAEGSDDPVSVNKPLNEGLVTAVYEAVLRLEDRGYFTAYHLVLGETLWRSLHEPSRGSMILPRDRIEPTLSGGNFYRTTALPHNEALLASLDGPSFDCVTAGDPARHPRFEFLRIAPDSSNEELYLYRVWERFAPRIREDRAVVRLVQST